MSDGEEKRDPLAGMAAWLRCLGRDNGGAPARHEVDLALGLLETAQVAVVVLDVEGRVVHVNRFFEELSGFSLEELAGRDWFATVVGDAARERARERFLGAVDGVATRGHASRIRRKDGAERMLEWHDRLLHDERGETVAVLGIGHDVTERLAALRALERANVELEARVVERSRSLAIKDAAIESSLNAIAIADLDGAITYANPSFVTLWGFESASDALGRSIHAIWADQHGARAMLATVRDVGAWSGRLEAERASGERRMLEVAAHLVRDPGGNPLCMMGSFVDVTARVAAELEVEAASEAMTVFKQLADSANQPIGIGRIDRRAIYMNDAMRDLLELPRETAVSDLDLTTFYTPETLDWVDREVVPRLTRGESWSGEVDFRTSRGRILRTIHKTFVVRDLRGEPIGIASSVTDISHRAEAERRLVRSEAQLRAMFDQVAVGMALSDLDGRVLRVNDRFGEIFARPGDALLGCSVASLLDREDAPAAVALGREVAAGELGSDTTLSRVPLPEGGTRWVELAVSAHVEGGRSVELLWVVQDVTGRREAELELRRSQERIAAQLREKEILLREIHHRVKNNLQVISSLLYCQAIRCEDPAVAQLFQESRDRVRAMAFVHETLYESADLGRVEFRRYAETLTRALAASYAASECRVSFVVEGSDAVLDIEDAVPCGLVTGELVTNALKYAFVGRDTGTVRVSLTPVEGGRLRLAVADDGIGMDAGAAHAGSLGLRLVRALAEQLRGRLDIRSDAGGTELGVVFPARVLPVEAPRDEG